MLGETGMGASSAFWSLARALAEVLPDGNRERTLLLGLTGNQENLSGRRTRQPELWAAPQEAMFTAPPSRPTSVRRSHDRSTLARRGDASFRYR